MKRIVLKRCLSLSLLAAFMQTACAGGGVWDKPTPALPHPVEMTVYRSPTCGCCGKWVEHMKKHGFTVKEIQSEDMDTVKQRLGVPKPLQSCHTALVDGYVVEGHVPAGDVKKLLRTKPQASGLAAPGMPADSPGMEMGGKTGKFSVILFDKKGNTDVFHSYSDH